MGKSFNDDVFSSDFDINSINGLNISKEAIRENQENETKSKIKIDLGNINIDEINAKIKEPKKKEKISQEEEARQLLEAQELIQERVKEYALIQEQEAKTLYTKKTMIFKQDYLDIIDGLAELNDMQIKDVLNQLLEKSINMLDDKTREKALKTGKKTKPVRQDKSIF